MAAWDPACVGEQALIASGAPAENLIAGGGEGGSCGGLGCALSGGGESGSGSQSLTKGLPGGCGLACGESVRYRWGGVAGEGPYIDVLL